MVDKNKGDAINISAKLEYTGKQCPSYALPTPLGLLPHRLGLRLLTTTKEKSGTEEKRKGEDFVDFYLDYEATRFYRY